MNKKIIYTLVGLAVVFFITSLIVFLKSNRGSSKIETGKMDHESVETARETEFVKLKIFFYREGSNYMRPIPYEIELPEVKEELYRKLIDLLLKGEEHYIKPIPEGVSLRTLYYIESKNLLVLDFNDELIRQFPAGTTAELEFIYFVVDNICYNFREVKKVKFLVAGNDIKTITGHIDMENAFYPNFGYIIDK